MGKIANPIQIVIDVQNPHDKLIEHKDCKTAFHKNEACPVCKRQLLED